MWYCAGNGRDDTNPNDAALSVFTGTNETKGVKYFGEICRGQKRFFVKMGNSVQYTYPRDIAEANAAGTGQGVDPTGNGSQQDPEDANDVMPHCHILNGWGPGTGSFVGCIAYVFYYGVFWPIKWFAGIMGNLFDFFLGYSLDDASYRADFAVRGWQLVRDISNIFFIIILVWTGLSAALGIGSISMKKVVPALIINALIINFSLFATRIVIDISNIGARLFYNVIQVEKKDDTTGQMVSANNDGPGGYKPLSEKIISGFDPQRIFKPNLLTPRGLAVSDNSIGDDSKEREDPLNTNSYATSFVIISIIAAMIVFAIAMMFWKTTFFFLGRTIGLYIAMIFSPFAFLTRDNMPIVGGIKELSWKSWWGDLSKYAILAPIFMFFLYIVYLVINSGFADVIITRDLNGGLMETVINICIPLLIIYFLVKQGVDIAKNYAGKIGESIQGFVNKTVGGAGGIIGGGVGLAAGGAAFLGRNVLARPLDVVAKKTGLQNWAAANQSNSRLARWTNAAINKNKTGSWDVRNAGLKVGKKEYNLGGTLNKGIGMFGEKPVDKISSVVGLGKEKKGIQQLDKERVKKRVESIKKELSFEHLSDDEAKAAWETIKQKKIKAYAKNWEKNASTEEKQKVESFVQAAKDAKGKFDQAEKDLSNVTKNGTQYEITLAQNKYNALKEEYQKKEKELVDKKGDGEKERLDKYGEIKNAKTLASAMRAEYAEKLRKSSFWMKDNKIKEIPVRGIGLSTAALTAASNYIPGVGTAVGAALATYIQSNADVMDAATKAIIDEHKKSTGKGSKLAKLMEKLTKANKDIQDAVNHEANKDKTYAGKKVDDLSMDDIEDALSEAMAEHQVEIDGLTDKLRSESDPIERKNMEKERAKLREKINRWRKAQENREKAQEDIDKHNEGRKKEEEGKEKKGGDNDNKGEEEK